MNNSLPMIITLREYSTWSLVMYSSYACSELPLGLLWLLLCLLWNPVMLVMTPVMPVKNSRYACYDSCYACYVLLLWPLLSSDFTSDFRFYEFYYISYSYSVLLPVFHSISLLLLSYHTMSTSCLISLVIYLSAYTCLCSRHGFQSMLMIRFYRYTWAYLARHLAFASPLAWGVLSDSPGSLCPGHGAWSVWILPVADQSGAAEAWIPSRPSRALSFQAPLCVSRVFLL